MYFALEQENIYLEKISYGLISIAFVIMTVITVQEAFKNSTEVVFHYKEQVASDLEAYLHDINIDSKSQGFYWNFNSPNSLLECHLFKRAARPASSRHGN